MPDCAATGITPDSRLGELLERWPGLEAVLLDISPHFRALENPVLRRTIAKVATLRQVSKVSGVALSILLERLRAGAGLPQAPLTDERGDEAAGERPAWASERAATRTRDARDAIEAGDHPMPAVMADLASLPEDGVYQLVTPFVPAPLVELAHGKGFVCHSVVESDTLVRTFFRRKDAAAQAS